MLTGKQIAEALISLGLQAPKEHETKKVRRFVGPGLDDPLFLRLDDSEGLGRVRDNTPLVIHPKYREALRALAGKAAIQGVDEDVFGSNFGDFPKKLNRGQKPEKYGIALRLNDRTALSAVLGCLGWRPAESSTVQRASGSSELASADSTQTTIDPVLFAAAAAEVDAEFGDRGLSPTTRQQLIEARLGQGRFRDDMRKIWADRCAVTGCGVLRALVASHAIAWRDDERHEVRLDPYNGLLLTASIDKLFDQGLISFADDGRLLHRADLSVAELATLGVSPGAKLRLVHQRHIPYLGAHRTKWKF